MNAHELIDIEKQYKESHNSVHFKLNQVNESVLDNMDEVDLSDVSPEYKIEKSV